MESTQEIKVFDHETAGVSDKIALISELEHIRRHAQRSAVSSENTEDEVFYSVTAKQARGLRRAFTQKYFPNVDTKIWCLCKATAALRQIAYEIWEDGPEQLREIDQLVDEVWGKATGKDLSGCEACKEDKASN